MNRHVAILLTLFLSALLLTACGSDANSEAKSIFKKQVKVTESYITGMEKAQSADDVVQTIEEFTHGMKELIPAIQEFHKNHPNYTSAEIPSEVKFEIKRAEAVSAKVQPAMMNAMKYMMDPKVQVAMQKMGEEMSKLEQ